MITCYFVLGLTGMYNVCVREFSMLSFLLLALELLLLLLLDLFN